MALLPAHTSDDQDNGTSHSGNQDLSLHDALRLADDGTSDPDADLSSSLTPGRRRRRQRPAHRPDPQ